MAPRKAAGATSAQSDTSENAELASECLATLLELAPVLTASEKAVLQLQVRMQRNTLCSCTIRCAILCAIP